MAKKRKSSTSLPATTMEVDNSAALHPKNPILSANTNAGISKSTKSARLPRGKGRRAQRLRKEKASERAEEVKGRTERKVERSKGRGRRGGERNAAWEDMNAKIKGALTAEIGVGKGDMKALGDKNGRKEEEWVDEDEEVKMLDDEDGVEDVGR